MERWGNLIAAEYLKGCGISDKSPKVLTGTGFPQVSGVPKHLISLPQSISSWEPTLHFFDSAASYFQDYLQVN